MNFDGALQLAERAPHQGLHGVFADLLPDGWGLMLMDRIFRRSGILSGQIAAIDRLAFVGNSGFGALGYEPIPNGDERRFHLHCACRLVHSDFRMPSLDHEYFIKTSILVWKGRRVRQTQFLRTMFILFARNQKYQSKNWDFLKSDNDYQNLIFSMTIKHLRFDHYFGSLIER